MTEKEFINLPELTEPVNHRPLLWLALELTKDSQKPVIEYGAGSGSTPYLREYCKQNNRQFISYDSNKEWAEQWGAKHIEDWLNPELYQPCSVAFVDQAPGEYRKESIKRLENLADIIVVHDAEPVESHGYALDEIWPLFEFKVVTKGQNIWTAAMSNYVCFDACIGMLVRNHKIEKL